MNAYFGPYIRIKNIPTVFSIEKTKGCKKCDRISHKSFCDECGSQIELFDRSKRSTIDLRKMCLEFSNYLYMANTHFYTSLVPCGKEGTFDYECIEIGEDFEIPLEKCLSIKEFEEIYEKEISELKKVGIEFYILNGIVFY